MIKNTKPLPLFPENSFILFIQKSHGEAVYLVNPVERTILFSYTVEPKMSWAKGNEGCPMNSEDMREFYQSVNGWDSIAKKENKPHLGKILHWEYL